MDATRVGTARKIVATVRYFITLLRLLLMSEANVSSVPFRMFAWIVAVSSACWYSTMASSRQSRSSSESEICRAVLARANAIESALSDVVK